MHTNLHWTRGRRCILRLVYDIQVLDKVDPVVLAQRILEICVCPVQ